MYRKKHHKPRHWCPNSETYATGETLLNYLGSGWAIVDVYTDVHTRFGFREINVYHFHLSRDGQTLIMPIVANPTVARIAEHYLCNVA
jgi:hypothetical protein